VIRSWKRTGRVRSAEIGRDFDGGRLPEDAEFVRGNLRDRKQSTGHRERGSLIAYRTAGEGGYKVAGMAYPRARLAKRIDLFKILISCDLAALYGLREIALRGVHWRDCDFLVTLMNSPFHVVESSLTPP